MLLAVVYRSNRGMQVWVKKEDALKVVPVLIAGLLEAAYSLNWGAQKIWGNDGGETLALYDK